MSKPTIQSINLKLEKHLAVSDERWKEAILRIKRIELYMISSVSAIVLLLIGLLVR